MPLNIQQPLEQQLHQRIADRLNGLTKHLLGDGSTTANQPDRPLTLDDINRAINLLSGPPKDCRFPDRWTAPNLSPPYQIHITGRWAPAKVHTPKHGLQTPYHQRIQKKWIKRHGTIWQEFLRPGEAILAGRNLFCRRDEYHRIIQALKKP